MPEASSSRGLFRCAALACLATVSHLFVCRGAQEVFAGVGVRQRGQASTTSISRRQGSPGEKEVVYNYFSQDYALVDRCKGVDVSESVSEFVSDLLPWTAAEQQALKLMEESRPGWREAALGPSDDASLRRNFRAIVQAAGGEAAALKVLDRNQAVILFGQSQIRNAGNTLVKCLGKEKALEVIQKNPGVLTIAPSQLKDNIGSVAVMADVIDGVVQNGEFFKAFASLFQLFFAVSIGKALFDVVRLRFLAPLP